MGTPHSRTVDTHSPPLQPDATRLTVSSHSHNNQPSQVPVVQARFLTAYGQQTDLQHGLGQSFQSIPRRQIEPLQHHAIDT